MFHTPILLILLVTLGTGLSAGIYFSIWSRLSRKQRTPTGFGAILAVALALTSFAQGFAVGQIAAFMLLLLLTMVYWLDDVIELSARFRAFLCLLAGAGTATCVLIPFPMGWHWAGALLVIAAIINLVLTTLANFYDGADLNLATLITMTALIMLFYGSPDTATESLAAACLGFILPFSIFNSRPRCLYLGDAGAFAFAGLLTILVLISPTYSVPLEAAVPLALPALDTFSVLLYRIKHKHNLLTRNYLHLYQQLERYRRRFVYLLPQIMNTVLVLSCARALQAIGVQRFGALSVASAVVTPLIYFAWKQTLSSKPPGRCDED